MCVIVVKCVGTDFAPADAIQRCIITNPHGFAMAWNEEGRVKTFKTMDGKEALEKYCELTRQLNPATTAMIFHARIATHGSHKLENCHCWVHEGPHGDICFAHNGVLSNMPTRDDMTDSEIFFRDFFIPALDNVDKDDPNMHYSLKLSRAIIGSSNSKFAFINGEGRIFMSSGAYPFTKMQFPGHKGKVYFSNDQWMPTSTYGTALGFDPYKNVNKSSKKGTTTKGGSGLPFVGKRSQVSPAKPVAAVSDNAHDIVASLFETYEKRYQEL